MGKLEPFSGFLRDRVLSLNLIGFDHCFAAGNAVCSWGRGEDGQLGHGDTDDRLLPTLLSALDAQQVVSVACGADHTIAYSDSRLEVYSWGWSAIFLFTNFLKLHYTHKCIFVYFCDGHLS